MMPWGALIAILVAGMALCVQVLIDDVHFTAEPLEEYDFIVVGGGTVAMLSEFVMYTSQNMPCSQVCLEWTIES
jgi:hypothetical protein